jgi:DNA polymerase elongation subunit (family B)
MNNIERIDCLPEFFSDSFQSIELLKKLPLKLMTLGCAPEEMETPDREGNKLIKIKLEFYPKYKGKDHIALITRHSLDGSIITCSDEKEMLKRIKEIVDDFDPNIINLCHLREMKKTITLDI